MNTISLALSPSFDAKSISPPERAGIQATTVFFFMYGANFSKYSPCANEGTANTMASASLATLGSFVMSNGLDLSTEPVSSVNSYSASPRAAFHLAASSAKKETPMVLYREAYIAVATCAALPPPHTNTQNGV